MSFPAVCKEGWALEMEYIGAVRTRRGEQERDRDGSSNPDSAPLLSGRDSGLDGTTANPGRAVLGVLS